MEIVLGLLLLFGVFSLGANTTDSTDHGAQTEHIESSEADQAVQIDGRTQLTCQASRTTRHYRDLTVPLTQSAAEPLSQTPDTEDDGWDE